MSHLKASLVLLLAFTLTGNIILAADEHKQHEGDFWLQHDAQVAAAAQMQEIVHSTLHHAVSPHNVYNYAGAVIPAEHLLDDSSEEGSSDEQKNLESANELALENDPGCSLKPLAQAVVLGTITAVAMRPAIKFAKEHICTPL